MTNLEKRLVDAIVSSEGHESIVALTMAVRRERLDPGKVEAWERAYWELLKAQDAHAAAWSAAFGEGEQACELSRSFRRPLVEKAKAAGIKCGGEW